jgi:membrane-anchored protein YejM (alkaline phosphatase superfamily)
VGDLLEGLRGLGVYDRALVVLASDHGEGLGEHGEEEHGILLYRNVLHVPLIVKLPKGARGRARAWRDRSGSWTCCPRWPRSRASRAPRTCPAIP